MPRRHAVPFVFTSVVSFAVAGDHSRRDATVRLHVVELAGLPYKRPPRFILSRRRHRGARQPEALRTFAPAVVGRRPGAIKRPSGSVHWPRDIEAFPFAPQIIRPNGTEKPIRPGIFSGGSPVSSTWPHIAICHLW